MGGFFGVVSKEDCVFDLFYGVDYHSHLGTRRAGMATYSSENGFDRSIHSIENTPFRTKFINLFLFLLPILTILRQLFKKKKLKIISGLHTKTLIKI